MRVCFNTAQRSSANFVKEHFVILSVNLTRTTKMCIGFVLGHSTALYKPMLKLCILTNKAM